MSVNNPSVCPNCGLALQGTEERCPRCGYELAITPVAPPPPAPAPSAAPPSMQGMAGHCTNCGLQLQRYQPVCPNCGGRVLPIQGAAWPPPTGYIPPIPPESKLLTGNTIADAVIGFVLTFISIFIYGIGLIAMPITYFSIRQTYRYLARGIGYGIATFGVLVLGVFVYCIASLSNIH